MARKLLGSLGKRIQGRTKAQVRISTWDCTLRRVQRSQKFNTHLVAIAVFTVTELQVILEHAGKKRQTEGL